MQSSLVPGSSDSLVPRLFSVLQVMESRLAWCHKSKSMSYEMLKLVIELQIAPCCKMNP